LKENQEKILIKKLKSKKDSKKKKMRIKFDRKKLKDDEIVKKKQFKK
jgi:hypothetical protein